MPRAALDDLAAFAALPAADKLAVAAEIAAELGADFRAGAELVGEGRLPTLVHVPSGTELVLIPGGTFEMGFSAGDRAAVERYFDARTEREAFAFVARRSASMTPAHEVRVRPFAIARQVTPDDGVSANEHARRIAGAGFRFPSEAEWEYVAREGGAKPFVLDLAATFWEGLAERTETAWGIAEPSRTVWLADRWHDSYDGAPADGSAWITGDGPRMQRGALPWGTLLIEHGLDVILGLAAVRLPPERGAEVWIRIALGPDEAGRWSATRAVPAPLPEPPAPPSPPPLPEPAEVSALRKTYELVDAMELDAAIGALATAQQPVLNHVVRRCLVLCDYPAPGQPVPLAEELTPAQRRVMEATTTRSGIGWSPGVPVPIPVQVRRRWLGLDPPSVLERPVELRVGATTVRWPLWRAWRELRRRAHEDPLRALLPSPVDRFEAAILIQAWGPYLYGLSAIDEATPRCRALGEAGVARATSLLDELLAVHGVVPDPAGRARLDRPDPIGDSVWGALITAVVTSGGRVEQRWEPILPFVQPYLSAWLDGVARERRDQVLLASFRRAPRMLALRTAIELLPAVPCAAIAEDVAQTIESRELLAELGARAVAGWAARWNRLAGVVPAGVWRPLA